MPKSKTTAEYVAALADDAEFGAMYAMTVEDMMQRGIELDYLISAFVIQKMPEQARAAALLLSTILYTMVDRQIEDRAETDKVFDALVEAGRDFGKMRIAKRDKLREEARNAGREKE